MNQLGPRYESTAAIGTDAANSVEAVLQEAITHLADAFDGDADVDGAELVQWFTEWRTRASEALRIREPQ